MSASSPTPIAAVATSTKNTVLTPDAAYSTAAAPGAVSIMMACSVWLRPLMRSSRPSGTICGRTAETAGCWIPAKPERIASAT